MVVLSGRRYDTHTHSCIVPSINSQLLGHSILHSLTGHDRCTDYFPTTPSSALSNDSFSLPPLLLLLVFTPPDRSPMRPLLSILQLLVVLERRRGLCCRCG